MTIIYQCPKCEFSCASKDLFERHCKREEAGVSEQEERCMLVEMKLNKLNEIKDNDLSRRN